MPQIIMRYMDNWSAYPEYAAPYELPDLTYQVVRQSTFLAQALTTKRAMKASDNYRPKGNERADAARWLLEQMVGEASVSQLAGKAHERFSEVFRREGEALDFVRKLAGSFT